jgi:hypothetical protein
MTMSPTDLARIRRPQEVLFGLGRGIRVSEIVKTSGISETSIRAVAQIFNLPVVE